MSSKALVWIGMFVGSTVGGFIPSLWGSSFLSMASMFFSCLGAIIGIYIGYKISQ